MKLSEKQFHSVVAIQELEVGKARKLFNSYKNTGVITGGAFDDDAWIATDEYANYTIRFELSDSDYSRYEHVFGLSKKQFLLFVKAYAVFCLGSYVLETIRLIVNDILTVVACPADNLLSAETNIVYPYHVTDFFSTLPTENNNNDQLEDILDQLDKLNELKIQNSRYGKRTLAQMSTYLTFNDILAKYWEDPETPVEAKLCFFSLWLWWNITTIIPTRPKEFILTPRNCLRKQGHQYFLTLCKDTLKGRKHVVNYSVSKDFIQKEYQIPEKLAKSIEWYIEQTKDADWRNELNTLFSSKAFFDYKGSNVPTSNRYFTYVYLCNTLKLFYTDVLSGYYHYEIVSDKSRTMLTTNQISIINLGDTRHLSLINMIAEGTTPETAMLLAGQHDVSITSHYYSNILTFVDCKVTRMMKRLEAKNDYSLVQADDKLIATTSTILPEGRCASPKTEAGDFSDCAKIAGPNGETGYCSQCPFYKPNRSFEDTWERERDSIQAEVKNLRDAINAIRKNNGYSEDIVKSVLRIAHKTSQLEQKIIVAKMGGDYLGQKEENWLGGSTEAVDTIPLESSAS